MEICPHRYAPPPNDIIWENLSDKRQWVNLKKLVANLFIFLVAFFLTTPQLIVHQLDPILNALKNITGEMNHNKVTFSNINIHTNKTLTTDAKLDYTRLGRNPGSPSLVD